MACIKIRDLIQHADHYAQWVLASYAFITRLPVVATDKEISSMDALFTSSAPSLSVSNIGWVILLGALSGVLTFQASNDRLQRSRYQLPFLFGGVLLAILLYGLTVSWLSLVSALFLTSFLVALSVIDIEQRLLPDRLTQPLLWSGLLIHTLNNSQQLPDAIYGAVIGYLGFYLLRWGSHILQGTPGLGYGDVKLFAALGAWTGWQALPMMALIAACTGILLFAFFNRLIDGSGQLPFGPCLSFSGLLIYLSQANGIEPFFY
jgi:prepilin signal peptidase PulO-like enzyme (type II secretory pathway)